MAYAGLRAKCCGCTEAFQASRAGSIPVARFGAWRSLVAHSAGGRAVAGSNPVAPISMFCALCAGGLQLVSHEPAVWCTVVDDQLPGEPFDDERTAELRRPAERL